MGNFETRCNAYLQTLVGAKALLDGQITSINEERKTGRATVWMFNAVSDLVEIREFYLFVEDPDTLVYKEMLDKRTITESV